MNRRVLAMAVLVTVATGCANPPAGDEPAPGSATTTVTTTETTTTTAAEEAFAYQPLWPFADAGEAAAWQESFREGGHQPWHLDADATALAFTTDYLGFAGIDQVVASDVDGGEALVTVGYKVEQSPPGTAAVLHLAKVGAGEDAPWEVVGTRDTTLTLTEPRYGGTVSTPLTAGGKITGVDESIRVQVHQPTGLLGESCCLSAGGENTPWRTTVSFQGATGAALTVVASTGGHVTDVEQFAITGVRPAT